MTKKETKKQSYVKIYNTNDFIWQEQLLYTLDSMIYWVPVRVLCDEWVTTPPPSRSIVIHKR